MGGTRMTLDQAIRFATHLKVWVGDRESTRDPGRESDANGTRVGKGRFTAGESQGLTSRNAFPDPRLASSAAPLSLPTSDNWIVAPVLYRRASRLARRNGRPPTGSVTRCQDGRLPENSGLERSRRSFAGDRFASSAARPDALPRTYPLRPPCRALGRELVEQLGGQDGHAQHANRGQPPVELANDDGRDGADHQHGQAPARAYARAWQVRDDGLGHARSLAAGGARQRSRCQSSFPSSNTRCTRTVEGRCLRASVRCFFTHERTDKRNLDGAFTPGGFLPLFDGSGRLGIAQVPAYRESEGPVQLTVQLTGWRSAATRCQEAA